MPCPSAGPTACPADILKALKVSFCRCVRRAEAAAAVSGRPRGRGTSAAAEPSPRHWRSDTPSPLRLPALSPPDIQRPLSRGLCVWLVFERPPPPPRWARPRSPQSRWRERDIAPWPGPSRTAVRRTAYPPRRAAAAPRAAPRAAPYRVGRPFLLLRGHRTKRGQCGRAPAVSPRHLF